MALPHVKETKSPLSVAVHDLRNGLTTILLYVSLLDREDSKNEAMKTITDEVRKMTKILDSLKDVK